jgi:hypothetical protein
MIQEIFPNRYEFYFKLVYTCETRTYVFNPCITITKFIEIVTIKVRSEFAINADENNIEVVETGQYDNINGKDSEKAPALAHSDNTLEERFGCRNSLPSFYIRIVPRN